MKENKSHAQSSQKKLIYILLAIVAAILLVAGGYFLAQGSKENGPVTNIDPSQQAGFAFEDEQTREVKAPGEMPGIQIPGYTIIPVKADSTEVEIELMNPEANNVYFQITMSLKDSGEQLFQTKLLKPGQHIYKVELSQPLAPGEYNVVIHYDTFSTDGNYTPKNGADLECVVRAA